MRRILRQYAPKPQSRGRHIVLRRLHHLLQRRLGDAVLIVHDCTSPAPDSRSYPDSTRRWTPSVVFASGVGCGSMTAPVSTSYLSAGRRRGGRGCNVRCRVRSAPDRPARPPARLRPPAAPAPADKHPLWFSLCLHVKPSLRRAVHFSLFRAQEWTMRP